MNNNKMQSSKLLFGINFHIPYFTVQNTSTAALSPVESFFFTLLSDAYLPLLNTLEQLENDAVDYYITIILSPTFINQLLDKKLLAKFAEFIKSKLSSANNKTESINHYKNLLFWLEKKYSGDLLSAIYNLASYHHAEIISSSATNAALPLLLPVENFVTAQIAISRANYNFIFHNEPTGFFIPNNFFNQDLIPFLLNNQIKYAITESNVVINSPFWFDNSFALFVNNPEVRNLLYSLLDEPNFDADKMSNSFLNSLQNLVKTSDVACLPIIVDASQISRIKHQHQTYFFDLLFRKICYDQNIVKLESAIDIINSSAKFEQKIYHNQRFIHNDLTSSYQNNYSLLLPDLNVAELQFLELKNTMTSHSNSILSLMATELLLAQAGDYYFCHANDLPIYNNRVHLDNFNQINQNLYIHNNGETNKTSPQPTAVKYSIFEHLPLLNYF